ncbi:MAG TPA: V-type ATPase subunit [Gemmatimonadaceae bacterium]
MTVWVDVVARTRGLATRMLTPADVAELARTRDLRSLATTLATRRGRPAPEATLAPQDLDDAEARHTAAQLRILSRWIGARKALGMLYEEEDCRTLRALLRDAVAGMPAAEKLVGLIPTPSLPPRTMAQLAAAGSSASMAALLATHGHPYGPPLLAEATRQQPDLFRMEHAIVETWARRATRYAHRAGRAIRTYVQRSIDLANIWTMLLVTQYGFDDDREELYIEGGKVVTRAAFTSHIAEPSRPAAQRQLDELVRRTPLAAATRPGPGAEERVRVALAREQEALARRDPLGAAAVIVYWLRLRGERATVQRLIWSTAAGAPVSWRTRERGAR